MPLKYKLDEQGHIEVNEQGYPIAVDGDRELAIDAISLHTQVPVLKDEAKNHRVAKEGLQKHVSVLEEAGIDLENLPDWVTTAKEAVELKQNIDDHKLLEASEVDQIKKSAIEDIKKEMERQGESYGKKIDTLQKTIESQEAYIYGLLIGDQFNTSKFIQDKTKYAPWEAKKLFCDNFKVETDENGKRKVVAYFDDGEKILSSEDGREGEPAEFEEAIERLINRHPDREAILMGVGATGGGATTSHGGTISGKVNPWKDETKNVTEQCRIFRQNPELARQMAREAGKTVNF